MQRWFVRRTERKGLVRRLGGWPVRSGLGQQQSGEEVEARFFFIQKKNKKIKILSMVCGLPFDPKKKNKKREEGEKRTLMEEWMRANTFEKSAAGAVEDLAEGAGRVVPKRELSWAVGWVAVGWGVNDCPRDRPKRVDWAVVVVGRVRLGLVAGS